MQAFVWIGLSLTCDTGTILLWIEILLGRLWLCWIHWCLRSSLGARWYKHWCRTYQTHWCTSAWSHNQRTALVIKRRNHLFFNSKWERFVVCFSYIQFIHGDDDATRSLQFINTYVQLYNCTSNVHFLLLIFLQGHCREILYLYVHTKFATHHNFPSSSS